MTSKQSSWIPDQAFTALGFAIPALARLIDKKCGISLGGWLILSEIKRRGKDSPDGPIILRNELTRLFDDRGFTRPNVTKILNVLFEKRLILRTRLTARERKEFFGSDGSRLAVVLTSEGKGKIKEFKTVLQDEFTHWYSRQEPLVRQTLNVLRPVAVKLAKALTQYEPE
jgi:DNA-binding MarR family transcriptional regulator